MRKNIDRNNLPENFCPVPFASLIFNPEGIVGSCREKGSYHEVGNMLDNHWKEIWNGEKLMKWREEFLTGNIKTCAKEIKDRNCNKAVSNKALLELIDYTTYQEKPPLRVSPDFNGQCNLTCNMCFVYKKPNGLYDRVGKPPFWEDAEKNLFPYVKQIDPLAGEPFIQKDFYRLIELTKNYDPKPDWTLTTNGYWKFNQAMKKTLDSMNLKHISVSMDAIDPKIYREIRRGDVHTVLNTVQSLQDYQKERANKDEGFMLSVSFLVQKLNAYHLSDFMKYIESTQLSLEVQVEFEPSEFSVMSWGEEDLEKLLKFYLKSLSPQHLLYCHRIINTILNSFNDSKKKTYLRFLDVMTNNQFSQI